MIRDPESFAPFLDSLRRFVRATLIPGEEQVVREDAIPVGIVADMRKLGLFGLSTPEEYGGLGLTMEEEVAAMFELGEAAPAYRALYSISIGSGSQTLLAAGTASQKARYLEKIASGEIVTALALTEPGAGSDPASLATTARRDGAAYVLNGDKCHVSNATEAGLFLIYARTGEGRQDISGFLVERGTQGMIIDAPDRKMGLSGMHSSSVHFRNCRLPESALLGGRQGGGLKLALSGIDKARLHVAAVCVGLGTRLLREALQYATQRKQFGQAIAGFQLIQAMLADSNTELYAGRSMTLEAARRKDDTAIPPADVATDVAACKVFCSEALCRIADRAVQIFGGSGYIRGHAVERLYRDARVFRILDGTSQIQQLVIARNLLRRDRETRAP